MDDIMIIFNGPSHNEVFNTFDHNFSNNLELSTDKKLKLAKEISTIMLIFLHKGQKYMSYPKVNEG